MVSAFQRDRSVFRVIAEHGCNMRHLQSLVVLLTQDWAFSAFWGAFCARRSRSIPHGHRPAPSGQLRRQAERGAAAHQPA
jgi:hypothetical protein